MTMLIPRPVRDLIEAPLNIASFKKSAQNARSGSGEAAVFGIVGGGFIAQPLAKKLINAVARIALAVLVGLTASTFSGSIPVALLVGALISLPTTLIVAGCGLLHFGGAAILASLASGSFATLGIGVGALAAGWISLEGHDILPLGILELGLEALAERLAEPLLRNCF